MSKSISNLEDHIGYWMRAVSNQVSQTFARRLEEMGVTVAEWVIMRRMMESGERTSPGEVARIAALTRGAVSKLIDRLLEKGLVTRQESAADRRYQDIELTAKARALLPKLAAIADRNDAEFFNGLSVAERRSLMKILKKLAAAKKIENSPVK